MMGSSAELAEMIGKRIAASERKHLTPIHEQLRFEGWIDEQVGRRIIAKATCHAGDTLCAEAEGLFLQVDFEALQEKMQARKA